MSDKINVFEILGQNHTELEIKDQEQVYVPDPDFNDAIKQLEQRNNVPAERPALKKQAPAKKHVPEKKKRRKALKPEKKQKKTSEKNTSILQMMLALAVILMFFTFVVNVSKVSGPSMEPGLYDGDRVVINRLARNFEKGDIIVFRTESGSKLVKRIIAVDGDVVSITPGKGFYVNGNEPEEAYIYSETTITDISMSYPVILNEDEYFVLGDNRMNSKDSRNSEVGVVKKEDILGKVTFCIRKF